MSVLWCIVLIQAAETDEVLSATIPKAERSTYLPILEKYKTAEAALATDALECEHRCDELINDKSVKDAYREKRVRIQNTDGSYGEWTLFLPFQLRARAKLARAKALAGKDRGQATDLAREARKDLEVSVQKGVKSSERILVEVGKLVDQLREAKPQPDPRQLEANARMEEIRKLRDLKAKPEEVLRRCAEAAPLLEGTDHKNEFRLIRSEAVKDGWKAHADQGRFRSASDFLATHGSFLAVGDRGTAKSEIENLCRKEISDKVAKFRTRLREIPAWDVFKRLPADEFDHRFTLPDGRELVVVDPALEASRLCRSGLIEARTVADPLALPLPEFLDLLAGVTRTPETAALAFDLSSRRLAKAVEGAPDLSSVELRLRREEVEQVLVAVSKFAGGAQRQVLEANRSLLPEDPPRLDEIGMKLLDPAHPKGMWGSSPNLAQELENELLKFPRERLSRESRQKTGTYLLIAVSARLLLAGRSVEEIVKEGEIIEAASLLDKAGGPLPVVMAQVSPKIRDVADRLKP